VTAPIAQVSLEHAIALALITSGVQTHSVIDAVRKRGTAHTAPR
jgi:hypothetical protein